MDTQEAAIVEPKSKRKNAVRRLILLAVLLALCVAIGKFTAIGEWFELETIRKAIQGTGVVGLLIFGAAFTVGTILHIPGVLFMAVALLVFDIVGGSLLTYASANLAVTVNFLVVRRVGGKALGDIDSPFLNKWLARIDARPITAVILLRVFMGMTPPLNTALALSNVGFRDHAIATFIGLWSPVLFFGTLYYFFSEVLIRWAGG